MLVNCLKLLVNQALFHCSSLNTFWHYNVDAVLNEMVSSDVFDQYTRRAVFSVLSQMQGGFDSSDRPRDASPVGVTVSFNVAVVDPGFVYYIVHVLC